jgi:demethylmacrocin O-methyltransferase
MDNVLDVLAHKYNTDKRIAANNHGYTEIYYNLLRDNRDKINKVMEIGIHKGGSLRMWRDFFSLADVYGLDNHPELLFETDRIKSVFAEQKEETSLLEAIKELGNDFDLIVDDGSHEIEDQLLSFRVFFPIVKAGGIYVIEDVFVENLDKVKTELKDFNYQIFPSNIPNYNLVIINK